MNWIIFFFLGTMGWGGSLYLIKILLTVFSPVEVVFYRMLIGAMTLLLLAKMLKIKINNIKLLLIDGLVIGVLNMLLPFYLTTICEQYVPTAIISILNGLTPLFTLLMGVILIPKMKGWNKYFLGSICLGVLGILFINMDAVSMHYKFKYVLAVILSGLSYAVAANYIKFYARRQHPVLLSGMAASIAATCIFILQYCLQYKIRFSISYPLYQYGILFWLGVVGTGMCLYLYCILIQRAGAIFSSMVTYLMTLTGVLLGVFILHETVSWAIILGCSCIVWSLLLLHQAEKNNA